MKRNLSVCKSVAKMAASATAMSDFISMTSWCEVSVMTP